MYLLNVYLIVYAYIINNFMSWVLNKDYQTLSKYKVWKIR